MKIATRKLKLTTHTGTTDVVVSIFLPVEDDGSWLCPYQINWPDKPWESAAAGIDSIQALLGAFHKIGLELYFSEAHKTGALNWGADWKGFGFPVPREARDELVGEDARFL